MSEKMIVDAYCRIRTIDQTIPDDVLNFMKDAALEKLRQHATIKIVCTIGGDCKSRGENNTCNGTAYCGFKKYLPVNL